MDTYNKTQFIEKIKRFDEIIKPKIEEALKEVGLEKEGVVVIPLPNKFFCKCTSVAIHDIVRAMLEDRSYFIISGTNQWCQVLLDEFIDKLIATDNFEGIASIQKMKEVINLEESHFLGLIPEESFFSKQD